MESSHILIVCTLFIASMEAMPTGTYEDIKHAVSNGLPWVNPADPTVPCATNLCQDFQKLCKNGGQCEMTPECGARCRCLKQYTGPFCGVKVKETITNGKFELLKATKTPDLNQKINVTTESGVASDAGSSSNSKMESGTTESVLQSTSDSHTPSADAIGLVTNAFEGTTAVINKRSVSDVTETRNTTRLVPDKNYKILKTWMSILDKLRVG